MVTRLVHGLGASIGRFDDLDPIDFSDENPRGFWEHRGIRVVNEKLMASKGCDWDRIANWDLNQFCDESIREFNQRAAKIVAKLDDAPLWVAKDPRMCLTGHQWLKHLEKPAFVFVVRSPIEVALSLRTRNEFPMDLGFALWEAYNLNVIKLIHDHESILLDYGCVLARPLEAVHNLQDWISKNGPGNTAVDIEQLSRFVDTSLHNSRDSHKTKYEHRAFTIYDDIINGRGIETYRDSPVSDDSITSLRRHESVYQKLISRHEKRRPKSRNESELRRKLALVTEQISSGEDRLKSAHDVIVTMRREMWAALEDANSARQDVAHLIEENRRLSRLYPSLRESERAESLRQLLHSTQAQLFAGLKNSQLQSEDHRRIRLMVGVAGYPTESTARTHEAIASQTCSEFEYVVIDNLPAPQARERLFELFDNSDCEYLVEIGPQVLLLDKTFISRLKRVLSAHTESTRLKILITDYYTASNVPWIIATPRNIQADEQAIFCYGLAKLAMFLPHESVEFAFNFGRQKAITARRAVHNNEAGTGAIIQSLERTYQHYIVRRTPNLLAACLGAEFGFAGAEPEPSFSILWQQSSDKLDAMVHLMRRTRVDDSKLQDFRDKRSQLANRPKLRRLLLIAGSDDHSMQVSSRLATALINQDVKVTLAYTKDSSARSIKYCPEWGSPTRKSV